MDISHANGCRLISLSLAARLLCVVLLYFQCNPHLTRLGCSDHIHDRCIAPVMALIRCWSTSTSHHTTTLTQGSPHVAGNEANIYIGIQWSRRLPIGQPMYAEESRADNLGPLSTAHPSPLQLCSLAASQWLEAFTGERLFQLIC